MQCLEKEPRRRYATALDLAEDLRRYLSGQRIRAKSRRLHRFVRRNRSGVALGFVFLFALVGACSLVWQKRAFEAEQSRQRDRQTAEVVAALDEAQDWRGKARGDPGKGEEYLGNAHTAIQKAQGILATGLPDDGLCARVEALASELNQAREASNMLKRLDDARLVKSIPVKDGFNYAGTDKAYQEAFKQYRVPVESLEVAEAVRLLRESPIRPALSAALVDWTIARMTIATQQGVRAVLEANKSCQHLRQIAQQLADDDPLSRALHSALASPFAAIYIANLANADINNAPAPVLSLVGQVLGDITGSEKAVTFLRRAQKLHPNDFWINYFLMLYLLEPPRPQAVEAVRYGQAALAIRPDSAVALNVFGVACVRAGDARSALDAFRRAAALKSDLAVAHANIASTLRGLGDAEGAVAAYREALRIDPKIPPRDQLVDALREAGRLEEARREHREAVLKNPNDVDLHLARGNLELTAGNDVEAAAYFRKVPAGSKGPVLHATLGDSLFHVGKFREAAEEYRHVERLRPANDGLRERCAASRFWAERYVLLSAGIGDAGPDLGAVPPEEVPIYAEMLHRLGWYGASARLYEAVDPLEFWGPVERREAAYVSALAGCGQGKDAERYDEATRSNWRKQSLGHLRAVLTSLAGQLAKASPEQFGPLKREFNLWRHHAALAGVRGPALDRLPASEREPWQAFWREVEESFARKPRLE